MNMNIKIPDRIKNFSLINSYNQIKQLGKDKLDELSNIYKEGVEALTDFVQKLVPNQKNKQQNAITDTSQPNPNESEKPNPNVTPQSSGSTQPNPYVTPHVDSLDISIDKLNDSLTINDERLPLNSRKIIEDITTSLITEAMTVKHITKFKADILSCIDFDTRANVPVGEASGLCKEGKDLENSIKNFKI